MKINYNLYHQLQLLNYPFKVKSSELWGDNSLAGKEFITVQTKLEIPTIYEVRDWLESTYLLGINIFRNSNAMYKVFMSYINGGHKNLEIKEIYNANKNIALTIMIEKILKNKLCIKQQ